MGFRQFIIYCPLFSSFQYYVVSFQKKVIHVIQRHIKNFCTLPSEDVFLMLFIKIEHHCDVLLPPVVEFLACGSASVPFRHVLMQQSPFMFYRIYILCIYICSLSFLLNIYNEHYNILKINFILVLCLGNRLYRKLFKMLF